MMPLYFSYKETCINRILYFIKFSYSNRRYSHGNAHDGYESGSLGDCFSLVLHKITPPVSVQVFRCIVDKGIKSVFILPSIRHAVIINVVVKAVFCTVIVRINIRHSAAAYPGFCFVRIDGAIVLEVGNPILVRIRDKNKERKD